MRIEDREHQRIISYSSSSGIATGIASGKVFFRWYIFNIIFLLTRCLFICIIATSGSDRTFNSMMAHVTATNSTYSNNNDPIYNHQSSGENDVDGKQLDDEHISAIKRGDGLPTLAFRHHNLAGGMNNNRANQEVKWMWLIHINFPKEFFISPQKILSYLGRWSHWIGKRK